MDAASTPTSKGPPSRRTKADDTRTRIFAAGAELFGTQGYHGTSVEQIARQAGVAKGTFFLHYPTKDALVTDLVRLQIRLVTAERERLLEAGEAPSARIRATVLAMGRLSDVNVGRAVLTACFERPEVGIDIDLLYQQLLEGLTLDARAAVEAGELRPDVDPEAFALLIMNGYLGVTMSFATSPRGRSLLGMLEAHVDLNLKAFGRATK